MEDKYPPREKPQGKSKDVKSAQKQNISAFDAAAKYLALSPRSEKEVRDRLYKKGYHKAEVEDAISRAKGYGYIDDARYAADFAEYYGAKLGKKKLEYKLVSEKGVPREIAANVLEDVVSEEAEEEKAFSVASKYAASKRITERKDLAKVGAYLWQRGFGRDTIDRALDRIASSLREPEE